MNHALPFALCVAGFGALAFASRRQQRDVFRRSLRPTTARLIRVLATCALLLALASLVHWQGWGLGLVMFSGHTSLAAGTIYAALLGYAARQARRLQPR